MLRAKGFDELRELVAGTQTDDEERPLVQLTVQDCGPCSLAGGGKEAVGRDAGEDDDMVIPDMVSDMTRLGVKQSKQGEVENN